MSAPLRKSLEGALASDRPIPRCNACWRWEQRRACQRCHRDGHRPVLRKLPHVSAPAAEAGKCFGQEKASARCPAYWWWGAMPAIVRIDVDRYPEKAATLASTCCDS